MGNGARVFEVADILQALLLQVRQRYAGSGIGGRRLLHIYLDAVLRKSSFIFGVALRKGGRRTSARLWEAGVFSAYRAKMQNGGYGE